MIIKFQPKSGEWNEASFVSCSGSNKHPNCSCSFFFSWLFVTSFVKIKYSLTKQLIWCLRNKLICHNKCAWWVTRQNIRKYLLWRSKVNLYATHLVSYHTVKGVTFLTIRVYLLKTMLHEDGNNSKVYIILDKFR